MARPPRAAHRICPGWRHGGNKGGGKSCDGGRAPPPSRQAGREPADDIMDGPAKAADVHYRGSTDPKFLRPENRQDRLQSLVEHRESRRSEEHTSELQSLMRISYAVFCLKKKKRKNQNI